MRPMDHPPSPAPQWRVCLLGSFRVERDGLVVERLSGRREHLLLAYLALTPATAYRREFLAQTFWPDKDLATGRRYLAYTLHTLLNVLEPHGAAEIVHVGGRKTLQLGELTRTDVQDFLGLVADAYSPENQARQGSLLEESLLVYGDGLLPGYQMPWVNSVRERLERVHQRAVDELPAGMKRDGDLLSLLASAFSAQSPPTRHPPPSTTPAPALAATSAVSLSASALILPGDQDRILAFVQEVEPFLAGPDQSAWLARMDFEYPRIDALLRQAIEGSDAVYGLQLASPLWRYWLARQQGDEGRQILEQLLEMRPGPAGDPATEARAHQALGTLAYYGGDQQRSKVHLDAAQRISGDVGGGPEGMGSLALDGILVSRSDDPD